MLAGVPALPPSGLPQKLRNRHNYPTPRRNPTCAKHNSLFCGPMRGPKQPKTLRPATPRQQRASTTLFLHVKRTSVTVHAASPPPPDLCPVLPPSPFAPPMPFHRPNRSRLLTHIQNHATVSPTPRSPSRSASWRPLVPRVRHVVHAQAKPLLPPPSTPPMPFRQCPHAAERSRRHHAAAVPASSPSPPNEKKAVTPVSLSPPVCGLQPCGSELEPL